MCFRSTMICIKILYWGTTVWLPTTTLKIDPRGVMSKLIKDLSVTFSSPIGFEVEWHSSKSNKWYQSQGHGFESQGCHCERGIVEGTTIWLPKTTLKTGLCDVISKLIKYLSLSSSSPIGFEVEWHSSRSNNWLEKWNVLVLVDINVPF